jgi:hypothetical protein
MVVFRIKSDYQILRSCQLAATSPGLARTNDWFTVPASGGTDNVPIFISPGQPNVFYRMAHP